MSLNDAYNKVKQFHEAFNHPVSETPKLLSNERVEARAKWMEEEIQEFRDARTIVDQADALIDNLYFTLGTLVEMGVRPEELFNIVQNANMAKLYHDGKPRFREDGKIVKPEGWEAPEPKLDEAIGRQAK